MHALPNACLTRRNHGGFTLVELMITIAIIGILAAVAIPAYNDYILRGKFTEAAAQLSGQRVRLEQYYQDNRNYGTGGDCGVVIPATKYFTYTCKLGATDQEYTISADGVGSTAGFSFTINQSNQRTTASVPDGWKLPDPNNCWVQKKTGSC